MITNEMIEAAKAKGREMAGNQPGALIEAFAEVAEAGATAALALLTDQPVGYTTEGALSVLRLGGSGLMEISAKSGPHHRPDCTIPLYTSPTPHLSLDREGLLEEARLLLIDVEEFVIDGITELKSQLEMNLPYPSRAERFQSRLDEARKIHASMKALYSKLEASSNGKA